jgi:ABC-2 type transport system ATP-binding protein
MDAIVEILGLRKTYASGFEALKGITLDIRRGEILALLGPNGAGKTSLINIICGLVNPTSGTVRADGHDVVTDARAARSMIGLVPQELVSTGFETVWATTTFSRGLFGKRANPEYVAGVLKSLSLWEKRDQKIMTLSGGMKRRVMIAKALAHEPQILFLDEPTAGVDVELRLAMWNVVRSLRDRGVTVILTTHYIEEAEEMADRIGVVNHGELVLVEDKAVLMRKLGGKQLTLHLPCALERIPDSLAGLPLALSPGGRDLVFTYDAQHERTGIARLLENLHAAGIRFQDLQTSQRSLEEIFVSLVRAPP